MTPQPQNHVTTPAGVVTWFSLLSAVRGLASRRLGVTL